MTILAASNAVKLQLEVGVATGLILAALGWFWRWASRGVAGMVDDTKAIKGLLVTDENGLGVIERLDNIDALIAARSPIFEDVRRKVDALVEVTGLIVDRTETLIPNGGSSMHDQLGRLDAATATRHPAARPAKKAPAKKTAQRRRSA